LRVAQHKKKWPAHGLRPSTCGKGKRRMGRTPPRRRDRRKKSGGLLDLAHCLRKKKREKPSPSNVVHRDAKILYKKGERGSRRVIISARLWKKKEGGKKRISSFFRGRSPEKNSARPNPALMHSRKKRSWPRSLGMAVLRKKKKKTGTVVT